MADPAELIRTKVADVLTADSWPHMLLSEKIDALLAALTPQPSAEDAAVVDALISMAEVTDPDCARRQAELRAAVLARMRGVTDDEATVERVAVVIKAEILRHADWLQDHGEQGFDVDSGYSAEDLRRIARATIRAMVSR